MSQKIKDVNFTPHWIEVGLLSPHPSIQHPLRMAHARRLKKTFDPNALGPLLVVPNPKKPGHYWIWDGQHRHWAASELFGSNHTLLCWVYELDESRLADLQAKFNSTHKRWQAIDQFQMKLIAKYPESVDIVRILGEHGLAECKVGGDGGISAVASMESAYRKVGPAAFDKMVAILEGAWGKDQDAYHTSIIQGAAIFVGAHNGQADIQDVSDRLRKFGTPAKFIGHARTYADASEMLLSRAAAELIVNIYNKNRRSKKL